MAQPTNGLPKVRIATPADEEEVMALCRDLHEENGLFTLSENKVRGILHLAFAKKNAFVGVIGPHGKIEASACLLIDTQYYSDDWFLVELWNHVAKPYRHTADIDALIEFSKSCSDRIGLPLVTGIISNNRVAGKVRKYRQRYGYPAGAFFVYNAKWMEGVKPSEEDFTRPLESRAERRQRERKEHKDHVR